MPGSAKRREEAATREDAGAARRSKLNDDVIARIDARVAELVAEAPPLSAQSGCRAARNPFDPVT